MASTSHVVTFIAKSTIRPGKPALHPKLIFSHRLPRPTLAIQPAHLSLQSSPVIRPRTLHLALRNRRTQPPQPTASPRLIHRPSTRPFSEIPSAQSCLHHTGDLPAGIPGVGKWGWVIYRTMYAPWSDGAWARFRARIERESRGYLAQQSGDAPHGLAEQQLEWMWVEDRASLDGVSRARLQKEVFRGWVDGELGELARARGEVDVGPHQQATRESRQKVGVDPAAVPRYAFFVQVDEEALRSLGEGDQWDAPGAHVKFVDATWEPMSEEKYWDGVEEEDRVEKYDEIDGCRQENVGWMRILPYMLGVDFYDAWSGVVDIWYTFYRRPPVSLNWRCR